MCGIAGWITHPAAEPSDDVLARMADAIRHRGPDDQGFFRDRTAGLAFAHRRLSIIDLSNASHQPMIDAATGVVLAYNGELYNFRDLRNDLEKRGHTFLSRGDVEVVLRSYIEFGIECLARFAGMFAIAIWDPRSQELHLARDPTGIKPLYYTALGSGVAFASEVKAFRVLPGFKWSPSALGLRSYIEFGFVFDESQTILEGVFKLAPGQRMQVRPDGSRQLHRYFTPGTSDAHDSRGESERVEELGTVLGKVVSEHLIADVPVGLLLSGGLDSSVIAALAALEAPPLTITMSFADSGIDERPQARAVSEFIGSRHLEVEITPSDVMREIEVGVAAFDDLFADWGTITTRLLYRRCREQGIKVVLVGEGSDELFGGYGYFDTPRTLNFWQQIRLYQRYSGRRWGRTLPSFMRVMGGFLDRSSGDAFDAIRLFETQCQLPNQYVMKVDKASMAESIEARAPFLDRRVAELAYRTPHQWLRRGGENKYLLRALARSRHLLPESISARPKFGAPLAASWMDDHAEFRKFARARVLDGYWTERLDLRAAMQAYFDGNRSGYPFPHPLSIFQNVAWRLLLLELWSDHYRTAA